MRTLLCKDKSRSEAYLEERKENNWQGVGVGGLVDILKLKTRGIILCLEAYTVLSA